MKNKIVFWGLAFFSIFLLIACSANSEKNVGSQQTIELWSCPMHPQIHKDHAGQCPICGMDLVKQSDGTNVSVGIKPTGHTDFDLSIAQQQMIGVKTSLVKKEILFKQIDAAGRVAFDPELFNAQNEYLEALKQKESVQNSPIMEVKHSAKRMVESASLRLKVLGLSDLQIKGLKEKNNLLLPNPGENIWVYAEIFEIDLANIKPGLAVSIITNSSERKKLSGTVVSVDRVINSSTRTAKARIQVVSDRTGLRPESYVDVVIRVPLGEAITVPFDAIFDTGKESWVFVVKDGNHFEPRLIEISERAGDQVAIASGLSEGETIVTSANFLIDSESRLKGILTPAEKSE